jgi:hypothetical protein
MESAWTEHCHALEERVREVIRKTNPTVRLLPEPLQQNCAASFLTSVWGWIGECGLVDGATLDREKSQTDIELMCEHVQEYLIQYANRVDHFLGMHVTAQLVDARDAAGQLKAAYTVHVYYRRQGRG